MNRTLDTSVVFPVFCLISIIISTIFIQFIHYNSQNRTLDPQHYHAHIINKENYKEISNQKARNSRILSKYKPVNDGSHYALITLKGTAPFTTTWYAAIIPVFAASLVALLFAMKGKRVFPACTCSTEK